MSTDFKAKCPESYTELVVTGLLRATLSAKMKRKIGQGLAPRGVKEQGVNQSRTQSNAYSRVKLPAKPANRHCSGYEIGGQ